MGDITKPTEALLARLAAKPDKAARTDVAAGIGRALEVGTLSSSERTIAQDIVRHLAMDVERQVRASLAKAVRASADLPHDVAMALASDVAAVAAPILTDSMVLTDQDLLAIIEAGDSAKQLAVAERAHVSESVAEALVERGDEDVVVAVVANPGAELGEPALGRALDRFGDSPRLHEPMIGRSELPINVAERLVSVVSERLREELVKRHELSPDLAADLVLDGRERATLALISDTEEPAQIAKLVAEMNAHGRLTDSILVRAACTGDLSFMELGLAVRAGVPIVNAQALVHDVGRKGLAALIKRAGVAERDRPVLRAAVIAACEAELGDAPGGRERFAEIVIERVLTTFDAGEAGVAEEDAEYLIKKLSTYSDTRRETPSPRA
ncbi:MAG: DUF2336 domain-containing protein [Alphaproteobacteria bacterium]|nr:DUF2336 domain-containing protein [Alphaproteobacteria bacterium]